MLYKYIISGCECWLSEETIEALETERKAKENVRKAYEIACKTNNPIDWSIYSDLYKDYYGIRPHY